jgi:hypothetical protein
VVFLSNHLCGHEDNQVNSWQIKGEFTFTYFDILLQFLGWQRDPDAVSVAPLEPTFASWSRNLDGELEYIYLPTLNVRAVALRGEESVQYLEELRLLVALVPSENTLAMWESMESGLSQSAQGPDAYEGHNNSYADFEAMHRASAYAAIELIRGEVLPVLTALRTDYAAHLAMTLAPQPADYAEVFVQEAVEVARAAYTRLWSPAPPMQFPSATQSDTLIFVAPAGMLREENELSREFPGGYRAVAAWLHPARVWVAWKYVAPGQRSGLAYNGLVWVNGHWAWFPKPYRMLAGLAGSA